MLAIEAGVYDAGAALEWARKLGLYADNSELDGFEGPTAIRRGLAFVPALSGLAAPYWDGRLHHSSSAWTMPQRGPIWCGPFLKVSLC